MTVIGSSHCAEPQNKMYLAGFVARAVAKVSLELCFVVGGGGGGGREVGQLGFLASEALLSRTAMDCLACSFPSCVRVRGDG